MIDTTMVLACGMLDETIRSSQLAVKRIFQFTRRLVPRQREANALMLRQFSLQWIIHNVPLRDGIQLSYDEFLSAIRRFGKYYNQHSLDDQLRDFYEVAVLVWQKFKDPPTTEEIKHALLEIAAKTLDNDLRKRVVFSKDVGLGEGLFKIAKEFYTNKTLPNESSLVAKVFQSLEGILQHEKHIVDVCHDYYSFLRDFIHVHFPVSRADRQSHLGAVEGAKIMCVNACSFAIHSYLKLLGLPLKMAEQVIDAFLSSSTQAIVASNFQQQRLSVSADSFQAFQLQIQILGIKGFLVWKRVLNGYKVSKGFALAQRANSLRMWAIFNEVQMLIPTFNPQSIQARNLKDFFELKVKQSLIRNKESIKMYHGVVKNHWVVFKIKSINQLRVLIKVLAANFESVNLRANKLYQEALSFIRNKKRLAVTSQEASQVFSQQQPNSHEDTLQVSEIGGKEVQFQQNQEKGEVQEGDNSIETQKQSNEQSIENPSESK